MVCDNSVQVRRVAFSGAAPGHRFMNMGLYILRYDDDQIKELGADTKEGKEKYLLDKKNYGMIHFKLKSDPGNGWAVPFVTGHKYKLHWGQTGLDFDRLTVKTSERWEEADKSIHFFHNFTD